MALGSAGLPFPSTRLEGFGFGLLVGGCCSKIYIYPRERERTLDSNRGPWFVPGEKINLDGKKEVKKKRCIEKVIDAKALIFVHSIVIAFF